MDHFGWQPFEERTMKKHVFAVALLSLVSASAWAAVDGNSFYWQADAGQTTVVTRMSFLDQESVFGGDQSTTKVSALGLTLERGLTSAVSVSLGVRYGLGSSAGLDRFASSRHLSGFEDLALSFKAHGTGVLRNLRYGVDLGLSPGASHQELDHGNLFSGGQSYSPYVGWVAPIGAFQTGGKLAYNWVADPTIATEDGSTIGIGYQALGGQAFVERTADHWALGAAAGVERKIASRQPFPTRYRFQLYSSLQIDRDLDLIPEFDADVASTGGDSDQNHTVSVAARYQF
jgi:hypothetical protein